MSNDQILASIEWQYEGTHTTTKGKVKKVRKGIPTESFWRAWKWNKKQVKALGLTLYKKGREATGEYRIKKGKQIAIYRSQWEVTQWLGNADLSTDNPF